jgi:probable rRNA maturation factor
LALFMTGLGHGLQPVSLSLTGDREIRALNRRHRGKDRPTDVLSFSYGGSGEEWQRLILALPPIGDLVISLDRAKAQAKENGWDLRTEVLRLMAHGCAHLAGYDHETPPQEREMRLVEEVLLREVGLTGLYPPPESENARQRRRVRQGHASPKTTRRAEGRSARARRQ